MTLSGPSRALGLLSLLIVVAACSVAPGPEASGCAFAVLPAGDCNPWLPPAASGRTWQLAFSEEFAGTTYDPAKLTPCFDWNYGGCTASFNQGREQYAPSQIRVSGGAAGLVAEPVSPAIPSSACQNGACTYRSGLLSTARPRADNGSGYLYKFTYGYVEARLKLVATQGFFTAFWMLPADTTYVYRTEIDILEHLGHDPITMFMTYHYHDRSSSYAVNSGVGNNGACPAIDYTTGFHRFGVDWQANHVAWYIDGVRCAQFDGDASTIENGPMQIILDLMVDNTWQRSWNEGLLDSTLVRQLEVDYIRVFQQH
ncbi:MAG TPA: glycoside hydrolase family 16 protein [Gemmatimonadales bacterium]|nr:glycoside hydrolase family 16 protein [Gemmatimonadales bacterium]